MSAIPSDPSPSKPPAATVKDEEEELAAEAGIPVQTSAPPADGDVDMTDGAVPTPPATNGDATQPEEKIDPNALPEDATETLYLNNLNEKVRLPSLSLFPIFKTPLQIPLMDRHWWEVGEISTPTNSHFIIQTLQTPITYNNASKRSNEGPSFYFIFG